MSNDGCDGEESFGNDKLSRADDPPPPPRRGVTCSSCGTSKDVDPIRSSLAQQLAPAQLAVTDRGGFLDRALLLLVVGVVDWTGVKGGVGEGIRDCDKGPPSNRGGGIIGRRRGIANAL